MPSASAVLVKRIIRARVKKDKKTPEELIKHLRGALNLPSFVDLSPQGIRVTKDTISGVPGYWLSVKNPRITMLYLHGGGFVAGDPRTYFYFCGELAKRLQANIFLPNYRKAPEFPFPCGLDDCFNVFKELRNRFSDSPLVLAGDSAGGNLTLTVMLRAKDEGIIMPDCALMISPASDVGDVYSRKANNDSDDMFSFSMITKIQDIYIENVDPKHPYISPANGNYQGFPPLVITVSESEALRDDAYKVRHKAQQAGVSVEMISRKKMPHVWPVLYPLIPEARIDMGRMVSALNRLLS